MEFEIVIDSITDCLVHRKSGKVMDTEYKLHTAKFKKVESKGWLFDWSIPQTNGYVVYELFIKGNPNVQGRIAVKIDGGIAEVDVVEVAPHNYGHLGVYEGVGAHLFAIACQYSLDNGCDGAVAFTAKSDLVEYYKTKIGAVEIFPRRMLLCDETSNYLLDKYIRK